MALEPGLNTSGTVFALTKLSAPFLPRTVDGETGWAKVRRLASQLGDYDFAERAEGLTVRALKVSRRGDLRRASLILREATALDESNAPRWMIYAHVLLQLGQRDDAERAMKQSLFLRERQGEKLKANVIRRLLLNLAGRAGK